jgi:hypothetical protein
LANLTQDTALCRKLIVKLIFKKITHIWR